MVARLERPRTHADCFKVRYELMPYPRGVVWEAEIDQLRRCEHGRVQICWQPPGVQPVRGREWRDISRLWAPRLYRRAVAALDAFAKLNQARTALPRAPQSVEFDQRHTPTRPPRGGTIVNRTTLVLVAATAVMAGLDLTGTANISWWIVILPAAAPALEKAALSVLALALIGLAALRARHEHRKQAAE